MDKTAMVSLDIDRGSQILDVPDRARVKVSAALRMFLPEYNDWKLVIAGPQFDSPDRRNAYRLSP